MITTAAPTRPIVDFEPFAPAFNEDPSSELQRLRNQGAMLYWRQGRCWVASRHEDILALLRDPRFTQDMYIWEHRSDDDVFRIPELDRVNAHSVFVVSQTDHARIRRLVNPFFSPKAVDRLRPEVQTIVDEMLASAGERESLDVAKEFALFPVRVMALLLRIPKEHDEAFLRLTDAYLKMLFPLQVPVAEREAVQRDIVYGMEMVAQVIENRRHHPMEGDLLTSLIQAEEQGGKLSELELLSLVTLLVVAGSETTVHLIVYAVLNLLRRPTLVQEVLADPSLLPGVLEETLRHDYFARMGTIRFAKEDVDIGGVRVTKGQMIMLLLGSGLRDQAAFPDADTFNAHRDTATSIAFGHGPHSCLGPYLARLEADVGIGTLLRRFPAMTLAQPTVYGFHYAIRKIDSLVVRLRP